MTNIDYTSRGNAVLRVKRENEWNRAILNLIFSMFKL